MSGPLKIMIWSSKYPDIMINRQVNEVGLGPVVHAGQAVTVDLLTICCVSVQVKPVRSYPSTEKKQGPILPVWCLYPQNQLYHIHHALRCQSSQIPSL